MLSLAAAAPFLALIGWIFLRRRFLIYLLLFVLIAFAWRLASAIYIDAAGPLYAMQLFRTIGGSTSSFILVAAQGLTLLAVLVVLSPPRLKRLAGIRVEAGAFLLSLSHRTVTRLVLGGVVVFLVLLYADMARRGVIPLLTGTEEYMYSARCAGPLHALLVRYGDFLTFYLGLFYANRLLLGGKPDRRFLLLFLGILIYMLLAGHRFSAFYRFTTFFLMPLGVVVLRHEISAEPQAGRAGAEGPQARAYRRDVIVVVVAAIALMVFGTYRSLSFPVTSECAIARATGVVSSVGGLVGSAAGAAVASTDQGALGYLQQRVLVQQGELWWVTYERIFLRGEFEPTRAFTRVFTDPILPPRRNSTIPYLMEQAIGDRAYKVLEAGSQYTGGFPEIFFELLGKVMAFPAVFFMSLVMAWLLFMLVESVLLQRAVRTFLVFYVLYAFILLPVTGMVNFLVNWKFWLKVAALVAWLVLEQRRQDGQAVRRVPAQVAGRSGPTL